MAGTAGIRVADLPQVKQFIGSVAVLVRALAKCGDLPGPVMEAADQVGQSLAALGGRDVGPAPGVSAEDRIRAAMSVAMENPGRVVEVDG